MERIENKETTNKSPWIGYERKTIIRLSRAYKGFTFVARVEESRLDENFFGEVIFTKDIFYYGLDDDLSDSDSKENLKDYSRIFEDTLID